MSLERMNLAEEFELLADDHAAPASSVDVGRAMERGRRTVRLRRTAGGLSVVGSLVLTAALTGTLPFPGPGGGPAGSSPPVSGVDPLVARVHFGWVPSGMTMISYSISSGATSANATAPEPAARSDLSATIGLTIFTNDSDGSPDTEGSTTVGTLNGYPALYSTQPLSLAFPGGTLETESQPTCAVTSHSVPTLAQQGVYAKGDASLVWHTASGQVASIDYGYVNQPVPDAATLMHVAETATFAPEPIPMPFSITGVTPAEMFDAIQTTDLARSPLENYLSYTVGNTFVSVTVDPPADLIPSNCDKADYAEADRVINGLHFYVIETSAKADNTPVDMSKTGDPQAVLDRITSHGPDPADWTTNVLTK